MYIHIYIYIYIYIYTPNYIYIYRYIISCPDPCTPPRGTRARPSSRRPSGGQTLVPATIIYYYYYYCYGHWTYYYYYYHYYHSYHYPPQFLPQATLCFPLVFSVFFHPGNTWIGKLNLSCDVIVVNHFSLQVIVFEWVHIKQTITWLENCQQSSHHMIVVSLPLKSGVGIIFLVPEPKIVHSTFHGPSWAIPDYCI